MIIWLAIALAQPVAPPVDITAEATVTEAEAPPSTWISSRSQGLDFERLSEIQAEFEAAERQRAVEEAGRRAEREAALQRSLSFGSDADETFSGQAKQTEPAPAAPTASDNATVFDGYEPEVARPVIASDPNQWENDQTDRILAALALLAVAVVAWRYGRRTGEWIMHQVRRRAAIVMAGGASVALFAFTIGPKMLADDYGTPRDDLIYVGFFAGCAMIVGAYHWIAAANMTEK
jgi:hypothetical protein